uniref:Uncharacterized protein n=1 Tax=Cylindrotheca closterium TaxID=2856 RepID=A0A023HAZ2_9STRA|nr:hypothetical protein [Cylindrotheca closterium]YP_009029150.1 hypothetical protein [Cylindrotheca closterium]AGH28624.1 hypothetical protein [Cylindrotheca closterium]AGH28681.1 hypothetical protein [Cylindrotheca closterium]
MHQLWLPIGIVLSSAAGNFSGIGPKVLLEPVFCLGSCSHYCRKTSKTSHFSDFPSNFNSTTDQITNAAVGGTVASKIAYMRAILTRGGRSYNIIKSISSSSLKDFAIIVDSVKTPVLEIYPYQTEFTYNSKIIIDNMFQEQTARRYLQRSTQKVKTVVLTYLSPMALASTKVNNIAIIG